MPSDFSLELVLELASAELAETVLQALKPEEHAPHEKRSRTDLRVNKNLLLMKITAEDATALRASANSYLKLVALVLIV